MLSLPEPPGTGRPEVRHPLRPDPQEQHVHAARIRGRCSSCPGREFRPHCLRDPVSRGRSFGHAAGQEALPEREQALKREGGVVRMLDAHVDCGVSRSGSSLCTWPYRFTQPGGRAPIGTCVSTIADRCRSGLGRVRRGYRPARQSSSCATSSSGRPRTTSASSRPASARRAVHHQRRSARPAPVGRSRQ